MPGYENYTDNVQTLFRLVAAQNFCSCLINSLKLEATHKNNIESNIFYLQSVPHTLPNACVVMCEYCNNPFSNQNSDEHRIEFAGFFSADAITAAIQQVKQLRHGDGDDDDDDSSDAESDGT